MVRPVHLVFAAASLLLAGGFTAAQAAQATDTNAPSRYVQMNSPGDGISSGAARTGNGRRMRRMHHRRHRHHHHHHHHHR